MIVCYFGTYREKYSRNRIMIAALRSVGITVKECHVTLWQGIEDRVNAVSGGWKSPRFWMRVIITYAKLIHKFITTIGPFDVMIVGYPGAFDIFLAKIFCLLKRKKLVWDVLMSIYQVSLERELINPKNSKSILKLVEGIAAKLADLLILDTPSHVDFFSKLHNLPREKFGVVKLGADENVFYPRSLQVNNEHFSVLYYGGFLKNHGVSFIIEAANILREEDIEFQMIGTGPEFENAVKQVQGYHLGNVHFLGYLEQEDLVTKIAEADVCLGVFGKTTQAEVSINNKIYECMAMGKAIITGDSLAIRDLAQKGVLMTCSRLAPRDLVASILEVFRNPALKLNLSIHARKYFEEESITKKIGSELNCYLLRLLARSNHFGHT